MNLSPVISVIFSVSLLSVFTGCSSGVDAAGGATIRSMTLGRSASLGPAPIEATGFEPLGTLTLFKAGNEIYGREPWVLDGTPDGTMMLRNIGPGAFGSSPGVANDVGFTVLGNHAYFAANDWVNGIELWRTDGTTEGAELFAEFVPGPDGIWYISDAAVAGNKMFLTVRSQVDVPIHTWVIEDHGLEP